MTPDQLQRLDRLEKLFAALLKSDRYTFEKMIQIADGRSIQFGGTTGTMIGTASNQKLGFYGKTPAVQQAYYAPDLPTISAPTLAGIIINTGLFTTYT